MKKLGFCILFSTFFLNSLLAADQIQCQLKNNFAEKFLLLLKQVNATCVDDPQSILSILASQQIAKSCSEEGKKGAVTLVDKVLSMNVKKLEYGDIAGDPCLTKKGYEKLLKEKVAALLAENEALKQEERRKNRNLTQDAKMAERRNQTEIYWNSPEGKAELARRSANINAAIKAEINNRREVKLNPLDVLKSKLRSCGITPEVSAPTSVEQACKKSLAEDDYDRIVFTCTMAFSCSGLN